MRVSTFVMIVLLVAASIILVFHLGEMGFFDVKCNPEDRVQITGVLWGFASNSSYRDYVDVRVDGINYTFYSFDKSLAMLFIGKNVEITACYQQNTTCSIENYYDMISIFLVGE